MEKYINVQKTLVLFLLIVVLVFSGCASNGNEKSSSNNGILGENKAPVIWIKAKENNYQPMYPQLNEPTEIKTIFMDEKISVFYEYLEGVSDRLEYKVLNNKGEIVNLGKIRATKDENKLEYDILGEGLEIGETYLIDMILKNINHEYHYYLNVKISRKSNMEILSLVNKLVKEKLVKDDVDMLGTSRIWIDVAENNIEVDYLAAKRKEKQFRYYNYYTKYSMDYDENNNLSIKFLGEEWTEANRYYYEPNEGKWYLGEKSLEDRRIKESPDKNYRVIYNKDEVVLFDLEKNKITEIYRPNYFDADYILDEYFDYEIDVMGVSNNGAIIYKVDGYINDESINKYKNIAAIYEYQNDENSVLFTSEEMDLDNLYYSNKANVLYCFKNGSLYKLDINTHYFNFVDNYLDGTFYPEQGIIIENTYEDKDKDFIKIVDLEENTIKVNKITSMSNNIRLLGVTDEGLVIGNYYITDTYEKLNREVIYPYFSIHYFDKEANLIGNYKPGGNYFFEGVKFKENECIGVLMSRRFMISDNPEESKVKFTTIPKEMKLFSLEEKYNTNKIVESNYIGTAISSDERVYADSSMMNKSKLEVKVKEFVEDGYKINVKKDNTVKTYYTSNIKKAFEIAEDEEDYQIYLLESGLTKNIFDSNYYKTDFRINDVKVIPQKPKYPRGCEAVSLAIMLDYYMMDPPNEHELVLKVEENKNKTLANGFVKWIDMNTEFAGSQSNREESGLGIYIEGITSIANKYLFNNRAYDLSGITFKQLLTFVSEGKPVQIIISNKYQKLPDSYKKVWYTDNGYIEVSYTEHSVVVIGYDENYVYISDPSTGSLSRKSRKQFKDAWESFGKRAMVIY